MAFEQPVCSFCERTMQAFNDRDLYCSTRCRMADVEANPSPLSTTLQNMPSPTLEGATSRARPNQVRSYIRPLPPIRHSSSCSLRSLDLITPLSTRDASKDRISSISPTLVFEKRSSRELSSRAQEGGELKKLLATGVQHQNRRYQQGEGG